MGFEKIIVVWLKKMFWVCKDMLNLSVLLCICVDIITNGSGSRKADAETEVDMKEKSFI